MWRMCNKAQHYQWGQGGRIVTKQIKWGQGGRVITKQTKLGQGRVVTKHTTASEVKVVELLQS